MNWLKLLGGLGSGSIAVVAVTFMYVDKESEKLQAKMVERESVVREYVDLKHENVMGKLEGIDQTLKEIKSDVREIRKREVN